MQFIPYLGEDKLNHAANTLLKKLPQSLRSKLKETKDEMKRLSKKGDKEIAGQLGGLAFTHCRNEIVNAEHLIIAFLVVIIARHDSGLVFPTCVFTEIFDLIKQIDNENKKEYLYHQMEFIARSAGQDDWADLIVMKYLKTNEFIPI